MPKKFPLLLVLGILLVIGAILTYLFYTVQNGVIKDNLRNTDTEITQVQNQINDLRSSEIVSAQRSFEALEAIKQTEVKWSRAIQDIFRILPLDLVERRPLVEFTSYSGAPGGGLALNAHTNPSTNVTRQLEAISETIAAFNSSPVFENAFVPSISKSITQEDESILTFVFNLDYNPSLSAESDETDEAIPRR